MATAWEFMRTWVLALVLGVAGSAAADEANWPQFRGPNGAGFDDSAPTLTEWDVPGGKGVLWKTAIPGLAHSSPIIWGDRLFVTTAVASGGEASLKVGLYGAGDSAEDLVDTEWKVYCLDRASGRVMWEQTSCRGVPKVKRHTKATQANSTPATDGKVVVASFGSEGLYAYDLEGQLLWSKDLGVLDVGPHDGLELQWGYASSPIIHDGTVYVQCDVKKEPCLLAFDARDGSQRWRAARDDVPGWCTPAILATPDGPQVVVNGCKHMGGYDARTGREIWRMSGGGGIPVPAPVVAGDLILLTSNHQPIDDRSPGQPVFAVRADARGDITMPKDAKSGPHVAWVLTGRGNYMQTPLVYRGLAYLCKDNGVATCYDVRTGEQKWRERIGDGRSGFTASPVAADGRVYWTSEEGGVVVVAAGPEFRKLAVNNNDEICMATPAIAGGTLYFRTRGHVIAIGGK